MTIDRTDAELVRAVRERGEVDAFAALVSRYQGSVYGLAYALVGDWSEAQDLTQETFIKAYVELRQLRDAARFAAWLRRLAFGTCIDWVRAFRPELYRSLGSPADLSQLDQRPRLARGIRQAGDPANGGHRGVERHRRAAGD
jgi:RNA polymerase sigma factor (sigma-70 family)